MTNDKRRKNVASLLENLGTRMNACAVRIRKNEISVVEFYDILDVYKDDISDIEDAI